MLGSDVDTSGGDSLGTRLFQFHTHTSNGKNGVAKINLYFIIFGDEL